jgi:hypothetical protein
LGTLHATIEALNVKISGIDLVPMTRIDDAVKRILRTKMPIEFPIKTGDPNYDLIFKYGFGPAGYKAPVKNRRPRQKKT